MLNLVGELLCLRGFHFLIIKFFKVDSIEDSAA